MVVILAVAAAHRWPWSLVGMEGRGWRQAPQLARLLRRAARHLNGEGRPPQRGCERARPTLDGSGEARSGRH